MKVDFYESEWWPVYEISRFEPIAHPIEIPDELYLRYQDAHEEFTAVQKELGRIYRKSWDVYTRSIQNEQA